MRTAVIVLGDLGRSPRMQYHAASLAEAGHDVDLVGLAADRAGLEGAAPLPALVNHPRVTCHRLPDHAFERRATGSVKRFVATEGQVKQARIQALFAKVRNHLGDKFEGDDLELAYGLLAQ